MLDKTIGVKIFFDKLQIYLKKYVSLSSGKWGFIALSYMEKSVGAPFNILISECKLAVYTRKSDQNSNTFTLAQRKKKCLQCNIFL